MRALFICGLDSVNTELTENHNGGGRACCPQRAANSQNVSESAFVGNPSGALRTARPTLPIWLDWVALVALPIAAVSVRGLLPAWVFMWLMAFAVYLGCK